MNVLPLLRVAARLLDLHDAERAPGNAPQFVQEERRGLRDGLYLDLASAALDALRKHAHDSGNAFLGYEALRFAINEVHPNVGSEDLRYVLNVLSRPSELWTIDRSDAVSRLTSDKASALIEKTNYAEDYRLTPTGRMAISAAATIQDFSYVEGDALKLLRSVEAGDFSMVPLFCDALLDTIRYESINLRLVIERGLLGDKANLYRERLPRYRQVVGQTAELLKQADIRLGMLRASSSDDLDSTLQVDVHDLESRIVEVWQALQSFGRELGELTALAAKQRGSVVPPPDFLAVALSVVRCPMNQTQMGHLLRKFGPVALTQPYPSCRDVQGKIRVSTGLDEQNLQFVTAGAEPLTRRQRLLFLEEHGSAILEFLSAGPLPLSVAVARGWCRISGELALSDLIGFYFAPWLVTGERLLAVQVPEHLTTPGTGNAGELVVSDIELRLLTEGAVL